MASEASNNAVRRAEEYFHSEDDRFLDALREAHDPQAIAELADRWKVDPRPWAREQKVAFFSLEPDCVGHQPIVKRLFKQAEEDGDDQVMAAAAALFDRLVRHRVRTRTRYDWRAGTAWKEEYLRAEHHRLPNEEKRRREGINPFTGEKISFFVPPPPPDAIYFSYRTRYYLQRRAWRYYKRLAHQGADRFLSAMRPLLLAYRDDDLAPAERIIDHRTLLQATYAEHPALRFGRARVTLAEGGRLSQLTAAPKFREHWSQHAGFELLIDLAENAPCRLVRVWALQLIEQEHAERISQIAVDTLLDLLLSEDPDVQRFADRLLQDNPAMDSLPVATWLRLVDEAGPNALPAICEAMQQRRAVASLSLADCVRLAVRPASPVARLALGELQSRTPQTEEEFDRVAELSDAQCVALVGDIAEWALRQVGSAAEYDRDHVSQFFDSLQPAAREAAWRWLEAPDCPGRDDPVLFCRLLETPYDESKLRVVELLQRRNLPGEARGGLAAIWTAVLLGVHRGGRQKLAAVRQLADAVLQDPGRADELLPVLRVAVRSVRRPESRAALAAAVGAALASPELAEAIEREIPELQLTPAGEPA